MDEENLKLTYFSSHRRPTADKNNVASGRTNDAKTYSQGTKNLQSSIRFKYFSLALPQFFYLFLLLSPKSPVTQSRYSQGPRNKQTTTPLPTHIMIAFRPVTRPLCVPDLSGHIVLVYLHLLQKHVQTLFILRQRVSRYFIYKNLQPLATFLDELFVKQSVVSPERHLALPRLARQRWHNDLMGKRTMGLFSNRVLMRKFFKIRIILMIT